MEANKYITARTILIALGALVFTGGSVLAFSPSESLESKIQRLEQVHYDQVEIIKRADEVIGKQYDIKMRAERSLHAATLDIATAKTEREMQKEKPNMAEVKRLNQVAEEALTSLDLLPQDDFLEQPL